MRITVEVRPEVEAAPLLQAAARGRAVEAHVASLGVGFGVPAPVHYAPMPAPRVVACVPPCPSPGYSWVAGYWYPAGPSYTWRAGYRTHPAFAGAVWGGPHYEGHRYFGGYWRR